MDFASLMSAQISKTKPQNHASPSPTPSQQSKYLKRSELEAARQAAYAAEQAKLEAEREERAIKKRKFEEEEAEKAFQREEKKRKLAEESKRRREEQDREQERLRRKRLGLPELSKDASDNDQTRSTSHGQDDISEDELISKLRSLDEPAILFGESHDIRLKRYRKCLAQKSTAERQLSDDPIPTTLQPVPEAEIKAPDILPSKDSEERTVLFRQLASYFNMVFREWHLALDRRDQSVKESSQGRTAYNAMVQSRENMKPLFKKFEAGDIGDGVLVPVLEIVRYAQARRYVDANDGYLRLSIGKA